MRFIMLFLLGFMFVLVVACDSYSSINISNETTETISVFIKPNDRFRSYNEPKSNINGFELYYFEPGEVLTGGSVIGEIDNDIPFDELKIVVGRDTLYGNNTKEIKKCLIKAFLEV